MVIIIVQMTTMMDDEDGDDEQDYVNSTVMEVTTKLVATACSWCSWCMTRNIRKPIHSAET